MAKLLKFLEEKFLLWGTTFLLFFIPLYPKFPLLNVKGTYVAIRIEDLLVALVIFCWLMVVVFGKKRKYFTQILPRLFLLYFLVGGLSVFSAIFVTKNINPRLALLHFVRRVEYMSLFFVAYWSVRKIKDIKVLGLSLGLSSVGVFVFGIGQKFFGWPVISTMNKEFSKGLILKLTLWARVNSTFAGHYDLAAFLILILCLTAAFFIVIKNRWARLFTVILGIGSYYLLILTASRVSFAAYLLAITLVLLALNKKWWVGPILVLSIAGMFLSTEFSQRYASTFRIDLGFLSPKVKLGQVPPLVLAPTLVPKPVVNPEAGEVRPKKRRAATEPEPTLTPTPTATPPAQMVESTEMAVARSGEIRFKVEWPRALRAFAKNPLLGTGYSSITLATDNDYLRMLGETGLLGTLAFMTIFLEMARKLLVFWRKSAKRTKSKPGFEKAVVFGIAGAGFGFLLNGIFIDVFEASKVAFVFWILMGVMVKTIDLKTLKHENIKT